MELVRRDSQLGSLRAEIEELQDKHRKDLAFLKGEHERDRKESAEKQAAELVASAAAAAASAETDRHTQSMELARRVSQLDSLRADIGELQDKYTRDIAFLKGKYERDKKESAEKHATELAAAVAANQAISADKSEVDSRKEAERQLTVVDLRDKLSMYRARLQANSRQHAREMQMLAREADSVAMENSKLREQLDTVARLVRELPMLVREAEVSGEMCERNMAFVYQIVRRRRSPAPSPWGGQSPERSPSGPYNSRLSPRSPVSPEQFAALERDTQQAQRSLEQVVAMHLS
jgi:hypothetical protein